MSQILFTGSSGSVTSLDANFTELYGFSKNLISDSGGNVMFGGKTTYDTTNPGIVAEAASIGYGRIDFVKGSGSGTGGTVACAFYYAGTAVGTIVSTSTGVTYGTTSDARLKEDIADVGSPGEAIDSVRVVSYRWKSDPESTVAWGAIAQELHGIFPEAVIVGSGSPGEAHFAPWGIDPTKLVLPLLREVQLLRARVAALEAA